MSYIKFARPIENLNNLSYEELIGRLRDCEVEIVKLTSHPNLDVYPEAVKGLGDFFIERTLLTNELMKRQQRIGG